MLRVDKRILFLVMAGAVLWLPAFSMAEDSAMDVSLRVKQTTSRDKSLTEEEKVLNNGDELLTTTELETEVCTLEVSVKQRGSASATCQLEWYFISDNVKKIDDKGTLIIFDAGKRTLKLEENVERKESLVSNPFEMRLITRSSDNVDSDSLKGDAYKGYIVLVTSNGEVLAKASNSTRFLKREWLDMCKSAGRSL
jgi:hypothetical protein